VGNSPHACTGACPNASAAACHHASLPAAAHLGTIDPHCRKTSGVSPAVAQPTPHPRGKVPHYWIPIAAVASAIIIAISLLVSLAVLSPKPAPTMPVVVASTVVNTPTMAAPTPTQPPLQPTMTREGGSQATTMPSPTPSPVPTPGSRGADRVVAFNPGPGVQPEYANLDLLLGEPDAVEGPRYQGLLQLGRGGNVLLAFVDNTILDEDGPDMEVFGESAKDDYLLVEVSGDGQTWRAFPKVLESSGGLDLADLGLASALYVRLTDVQPGTPTGAEVDAVVALHSGPPHGGGLPQLPDAVARNDMVLYSGPDRRTKKIGEVAEGETLSILGRGEVAGWVKVETDSGNSGWCQTSGLGLNTDLKEAAVAQSPPTTHREAETQPAATAKATTVPSGAATQHLGLPEPDTGQSTMDARRRFEE